MLQMPLMPTALSPEPRIVPSAHIICFVRAISICVIRITCNICDL